MVKVLTAIGIAALKPREKSYEERDGGVRGLRVRVFPTGKKSYIVRLRFKRVPVNVMLGSVITDPNLVPADQGVLDAPLALAQARELAAKALREAKSGIDPRTAKRQQAEAEHTAADTYQSVAEEYLRREGPRLRSRDQRRADLALLYAEFGSRPITSIRRVELVRAFDRIEDERGPARSNRVQSTVKRQLNWFSGRNDYISVLTRVPARISVAERARTHCPSDDELRAIVLACEQDQGPFGRYLLFTLLCACRRSESAGLRRSEISPDGTVWVIPKARVKNKTDFLIPLSGWAQRIIASQPDRGDFVFGIDGRYPLANFDAHKKRFDAACGVTGWVIHDLIPTALMIDCSPCSCGD
jgi:integrase